MRITEKPIESILPYARNPRVNEAAVTGVASSIEEFGFQQPLVVDSKNVVVVGHTRLLAAKRLNLENVPCVVADNLSETQLKAYRLLDNKLNEKASWDSDLLSLELDDLEDFDFEPFEVGDWDVDGESNVNVEEDELPSEPENPQTELGDVWKLGKHTVVCGDSLTSSRDGFDILVTDPPYGMSFVSNYRKEKHSAIIGDDAFPTEFINTVISEAKFASYVFCRWNNLGQFKEPKSVLAWVKNNWSMGDLKHEHGRQWEACCFYPGKMHNFKSRISDVVECGRTGNPEHPTQKPVELFVRLLDANEGRSVFDPYLGSGTTLIAAERLNRICYGIELEPKYVDVICQRFYNETGIIPETEGGKKFEVNKDGGKT